MHQRLLSILTLFLGSNLSYSQEIKHEKSLGFSYGFGSEFENRNYTYTNHLYKLQYFYQITTSERKIKYGLLIQPEVNLATHQLLNLYFVEPSEPGYLGKREDYIKFKHLNEYALNIGFTARKNFSKHFSMYLLGSCGPLIMDTETERVASGFAFADVFAVGLSYKTPLFMLDVRPVLRHVSNAGTQFPNSGITTKNLEFAVSFPL